MKGIPSLFILSSDGKILTHCARGDTSSKGVEAIESWSKDEQFHVPIPKEFR